MFPNENINVNIQNDEQKRYIGKTYLYDFTNKCFVMRDGKLVETTKIESIKHFISWTLRTQMGKFKIYEKDYGIDKDSIIGLKTLPNSFLNVELKRNIQEELTKHPYIISVQNFNYRKVKNTLHIEFTANTTEGNLNISEVF